MSLFSSVYDITSSKLVGLIGDMYHVDGPVGSATREDCRLYSMAISGDILYTGSHGPNIHMWKNLNEISIVKTNSALVKAIVVCKDRMFTGHGDGTIGIWRMSQKDMGFRTHMGSLPSMGDCFKSWINPKNYVTARRHNRMLHTKHMDAISCLSLNVEDGILYSSSWDKSFKVWRIADSKCMESIEAHDDVVNCIMAGFSDLVLTGSADGTLKVWQNQWRWKKGDKDEQKMRHFLVQLLFKDESAVTTLVADVKARIVYSGLSDGGVNFWEKGGKFKYGGILRGHRSPVLCLAVSSILVFSGSADATICVWKKVGVEHMWLTVLRGHVSPIKCLAVEEEERKKISKSGKRWRIFSGGFDGSLKAWQVTQVAS